jgi:hypothetical protein
MAEYTNIVPPRIPFLDASTGFISREWYQFFLSLYTLTGSGTNNVSLSDLQVGPPPLESTYQYFITVAQDDTLTWLSMHT